MRWLALVTLAILAVANCNRSYFIELDYNNIDKSKLIGIWKATYTNKIEYDSFGNNKSDTLILWDTVSKTPRIYFYFEFMNADSGFLHAQEILSGYSGNDTWNIGSKLDYSVLHDSLYITFTNLDFTKQTIPYQIYKLDSDSLILIGEDDLIPNTRTVYKEGMAKYYGKIPWNN
jgi:hypothetical protein